MWRQLKRWWWRKASFGVDVSYEFYAPSSLMSSSNTENFRWLFARLISDVDMELLSECIMVTEDDNENPKLNGPTVLQAIKTSAIVMHLWPGVGPRPGVGYGRLTISTCKPDSLDNSAVFRRLKLTLRAHIFHRSVDRWRGPDG